MRKQSPAKTNRQFVPKDKKAQDSVPKDHKKSQAQSNEAERLIHRPAAVGFTVEDEDWNSLEGDRSRLKEALGIDDDDFCEGILYQLYGLTAKGEYGDATFNFVLSVLKDVGPVDKFYAMLVVLMAVCHLAAMKQAQILLKSVQFELPADFQLAIHDAKYDTSRLDKQKIKVDDLPLRQSGERSVSRLMQTYVLLLQTSIAYRRAAEPSVKGQQVYASARRQDFQSDGTEAVRHKAQKRGLNGSRQSAARFTDRSKPPMNSNKIQKTNGRAPS